MEKTALRGDELPVTEVGKPRLRGRLLDTWQRSSFICGLPALSVVHGVSDQQKNG